MTTLTMEAWQNLMTMVAVVALIVVVCGIIITTHKGK